MAATEFTAAEAERLGRAAFECDAPCNPFAEPAFEAMLVANPEVGANLPTLKAWSRGWQAANLAAPMPDEELL